MVDMTTLHSGSRRADCSLAEAMKEAFEILRRRSSGNNNDGTITGGLTQDDYWADDRGSNSNRALALFEGQWMDIPDSVKADEMSFSSWIYITGTDGSAAPILSASGKRLRRYRLRIQASDYLDSHLRFEAIAPYTAGGARVSTSPDAMNMNQWYYVAATYDGISTPESI